MKLFLSFILLFVIAFNDNARAQYGSMAAMNAATMSSMMAMQRTMTLAPFYGSNTKIHYEYHPGTVYLKNGDILLGEIKYNPPTSINYRSETQKPIKVKLEDIEKMVIKGVEKKYINYRPDSTEYYFINDMHNIYRKLTSSGKIELYDNSFIIDESYTATPVSEYLVYNQELGWKKIKKIGEMLDYVGDHSLKKLVDATDNFESNYPEIIIEFVKICNADIPLSAIKWQSISIFLKNGTVSNGKGIVQPISLTKDKKLNVINGVHFYKDNIVQSIDIADIDSVICKNTHYIAIENPVLKISTLAAIFISEGKTFYIVASIDNSSFMGVPKKYTDDQYDVFVLNNKGDKYRKWSYPNDVLKEYEKQNK